LGVAPGPAAGAGLLLGARVDGAFDATEVLVADGGDALAAEGVLLG